MDRDDEARLVAALRQGDPEAFGPVYDAYRSRLFTFILRMVNRRAIAEELAQEVWLRLAERARALREDTRLEPWLFTVARNLCISYWRTRGIEGLHDGSQETIDLVPSGGAPPDRRAESSELRARLEAALSRLSRPYREALLLVGVEGMPAVTAAAVCGLTPEAMRKRLERAREMLSAELERAQRLPTPDVGLGAPVSERKS